MSNIEKYPKCHMRTSIGNCDPIGGFCTSVKTVICEALHKVAKPKTGRWIQDDDYICDQCGYHMIVGGGAYNFCPNCGARMKGEEE